MMKKITDTAKDKDYQKPAIGLVLELEFMLFPGRQLMYEAFRSVLKHNQITLEPVLFSRYCLQRTIEKNLQRLLAALGKKELAMESIAAKIKQQFESSLYAPANLPIPGLLALLKKAVENNVKVGLLSFLPRENAAQLMARLPFEQTVCLHTMKKEADTLPTPDSWLSLLKEMTVVPHCAIALTDGTIACKSALAVGMRCVVAPDCFTSWQDLTGADLVTENVSELKLNEILALLTTAHLRERVK